MKKSIEKIDIEVCSSCRGLTTSLLEKFATTEVEFHKSLGATLKRQFRSLSKFIDEKMEALGARASQIVVE